MLAVGDLVEVPAEEPFRIGLRLGSVVNLMTRVLLQVAELSRVERAARNRGRRRGEENLLRCQLVPQERTLGRLELVWDPLLEALEAAPCPSCGRPSFAFSLARDGRVQCPACADWASSR